VDQLPGGTAEDYEMHIVESIDRVAEVYCAFYTTDFDSNRSKIISHIRNTMTDRAAINHATIVRLENTWRIHLNELNCHLHPLDTIASSSILESELVNGQYKLDGHALRSKQFLD
jgi:hypothetical protein